MKRFHLVGANFLCGLVMCDDLPAQDNNPSLLLNPQSAFVASTSLARQVTLGPQVDGKELSFVSPEILVHKNTDQSEFISAVWKDASGLLTHQRDVLVVKPDYAVVVDYLYDKGEHGVARSFVFPPGKMTADGSGVQVALDGGKNLRVQPIVPAGAEGAPALLGQAASFSAKVTAPVPLATALVTWTGNAAPKIIYVKPANPMIVKLQVTFPDGRVDEVALSWEVRPLHLSGQEFKGWAAFLRQGPSGMSSIEIN